MGIVGLLRMCTNKTGLGRNWRRAWWLRISQNVSAVAIVHSKVNSKVMSKVNSEQTFEIVY